MKCHYEVLGLERDADEGQIKMSYRKMALRWHPDKNLDNPDGAKTQFQLVQQAYEVLSDMQERAWYDKHREQILRGGNSDYEDKSLDVFQYFTACYKGFADDDSGFYSVYREVFHQLATEEVEFLDKEEEFDLIPKFGTSKSDYDEVVHTFYAFWQCFCTKKSYSWLSSHNINEIRDRRILKVLEKENKKIQQKARKERNEEIRSLVAFVRKRDKRVQANRKILEQKAADNRKRQAEIDLQLILKRKQEIEEQKKSSQGSFLNDGYEEQLRLLEKTLRISDDEEEVLNGNGGMADIHIEGDFLGEDLEGFGGEFYCVACNKTFRNQSSFRNHETSKKHKENVQKIKNEMVADVSSSEEELIDNFDGEHLAQNREVEVPLEKIEAENDELGDDSDVEIETPGTSSKKNKKQKKQQNKKPSQNFMILSDSDEEKPIPNYLGQHLSDSDDDNWGSKKSKTKLKKSSKNMPKISENKVDIVAVEKLKKVKTSTTVQEDEGSIDTEHVCVTCKDQFSSKNKLFAHLKKTNHGVALSSAKGRNRKK